MEKKLKIFFIILIVIALLLSITYTYANNQAFFEITKLEVTKSEKIEMTVNLDAITYDKSIFELASDQTIIGIETKEQIEIEKDENEIIIEIDKETTNLTSITLYYEIPESKEVGDTIKFVATIKNAENVDETKSVELEVKIVEEKEEIKENNEPKDNMQNKQNEQIDNKQETNAMQENNNKDNSSSIQSSSKENQNTEQTVTYNGSNNNYLSSLVVENQTLNKEFSKENATYFMTVESDITSLVITATAEDDTATVCVYGNEDLKEGTNKILIYITAENGNVRNYRIYVTKNA